MPVRNIPAVDPLADVPGEIAAARRGRTCRLTAGRKPAAPAAPSLFWSYPPAVLFAIFRPEKLAITLDDGPKPGGSLRAA